MEVHQDAIAFHERVSAFAIDRGWYLPWDIKSQIGSELNNIGTALQVAKLPD
jgi:similar to spore coat protein